MKRFYTYRHGYHWHVGLRGVAEFMFIRPGNGMIGFGLALPHGCEWRTRYVFLRRWRVSFCGM